MNFQNALNKNIITQDEFDLLAMVNEHADELETDMLASEKLNEILERVWQWEITSSLH
jgi:hypothetical protein